ncbi:MAG: ubiquinone/menaquinone biosynthesis methyltransferase [Acidobacteria bacterium]|nr:ubiquinone/menaquinone biosynthesis methyltransferase [Acidobacteriota bacterium]
MPNLYLKEHISSKQTKQLYVNQLFETIASRYDFFTVFYSYGMDRSWKRKLIEMLNLLGDEKVLDIACGTGDITLALGEHLHSGDAIGLDIIQAMIEIAESKRHAKNVSNVSFHRGDAMSLPFTDDSFDCVTCGYALRNVPDVELALCEIKRVLKPGGCFYSLDFAHPHSRIFRWIYLHYLIITGSIVGYILHGDPDTYRYIPESLKLSPGQIGVQEMMDRLGFVETGFHEVCGGIAAINYGSKPNRD